MHAGEALDAAHRLGGRTGHADSLKARLVAVLDQAHRELSPALGGAGTPLLGFDGGDGTNAWDNFLIDF
jgi:hypothetical protein